MKNDLEEHCYELQAYGLTFLYRFLSLFSI